MTQFDHQRREWDDSGLIKRVIQAKIREAKQLGDVGVGFTREEIDKVKALLVAALDNCSPNDHKFVRLIESFATLYRLDQTDRLADQFASQPAPASNVEVIKAMFASVNVELPAPEPMIETQEDTGRQLESPETRKTPAEEQHAGRHVGTPEQPPEAGAAEWPDPPLEE